MPDKTDEKQRKFQKGKSGNPHGRPKGTRNKATVLAEALLQTEIEAICRKAVEEAKNGNIQAIKIILDRILPPKKESPIHIDIVTFFFRPRTHIISLLQFLSNSSGERYPKKEWALCLL